jgi:hypothetical protein
VWRQLWAGRQILPPLRLKIGYSEKQVIKRILPFLILALLLALVAPSVALAQDEGIISGQVVAEDGGDVSGMEVTLAKYQGQAELTSETITTDSQGRFQFTKLPTTSDYVYLVSVTYKEVVYHGDIISFGAGEKEKDNVNLNVYSTTASDPGITVVFSHTIISVEEGSLLVKENLIFSNPSDQTYVGSEALPDGKKSTLRFWLPAEATDVQLGNGFAETPSLTPDGFVDTMPVPPDEPQMGFSRQMAFSYRLKYEGEYSLSHIIYYPTSSYALLVQDGGTKVEAPQLNQLANMDISGTTFFQLAGQDLPANTPLPITISGLPKSGGRFGYLKWLALGLGLALASLILGLFALRRRPKPVPVESERHKLLIQLADLDDDFEAGRLPEGEYRETRSRIKAKLMDLTGQGKSQA